MPRPTLAPSRLLVFSTSIHSSSECPRPASPPDPMVIAGQGTIGLELLEDRPDLETILVPLSGGGYRVETSYRDAHFLNNAHNLVCGIRIEQRRQLGMAESGFADKPVVRDANIKVEGQ